MESFWDSVENKLGCFVLQIWQPSLKATLDTLLTTFFSVKFHQNVAHVQAYFRLVVKHFPRQCPVCMTTTASVAIDFQFHRKQFVLFKEKNLAFNEITSIVFFSTV